MADLGIVSCLYKNKYFAGKIVQDFFDYKHEYIVDISTDKTFFDVRHWLKHIYEETNEAAEVVELPAVELFYIDLTEDLL